MDEIRRPEIKTGMAPPDLTARVVAMIERMQILGRDNRDLALLLEELTPFLQPSRLPVTGDGEKRR